jgi:hypothetical protein
MVINYNECREFEDMDSDSDEGFREKAWMQDTNVNPSGPPGPAAHDPLLYNILKRQAPSRGEWGRLCDFLTKHTRSNSNMADAQGTRDDYASIASSLTNIGTFVGSVTFAAVLSALFSLTYDRTLDSSSNAAIRVLVWSSVLFLCGVLVSLLLSVSGHCSQRGSEREHTVDGHCAGDAPRAPTGQHSSRRRYHYQQCLFRSGNHSALHESDHIWKNQAIKEASHALSGALVSAGVFGICVVGILLIAMCTLFIRM